MTVRTITRNELVNVAKMTIELAKASAYVITDEMCEQILAAARAAPRVAGDGTWWVASSECGCLVGWVLKDSPDVMTQPAWEQVGYSYLDAMQTVLGADRWTRLGNVLEVVDGV